MAITYSRLTQDFKVNNNKCSIEALNPRFKNSELKVLVVSKTTRIPFFGEIPPVHPEKLNYVIATKFCTEFCEAYIKPKELESIVPSEKKHKQKKLLLDKDFNIPLKFTHPRKQKKSLTKKSEKRYSKRSKRLTKIRKRNCDAKFEINTDFVLNKHWAWSNDCSSGGDLYRDFDDDWDLDDGNFVGDDLYGEQYDDGCYFSDDWYDKYN